VVAAHAIYIVETNGRIALAALDPDYRVSLAPNDILSGLACLRRRGR